MRKPTVVTEKRWGALCVATNELHAGPDGSTPWLHGSREDARWSVSVWPKRKFRIVRVTLSYTLPKEGK